MTVAEESNEGRADASACHRIAHGEHRRGGGTHVHRREVLDQSHRRAVVDHCAKAAQRDQCHGHGQRLAAEAHHEAQRGQHQRDGWRDHPHARITR